MNWESGTYYQLTDIVVAGNYIYAGYYVFDDVNKMEWWTRMNTAVIHRLSFVSI